MFAYMDVGEGREQERKLQLRILGLKRRDWGGSIELLHYGKKTSELFANHKVTALFTNQPAASGYFDCYSLNK